MCIYIYIHIQTSRLIVRRIGSPCGHRQLHHPWHRRRVPEGPDPLGKRHMGRRGGDPRASVRVDDVEKEQGDNMGKHGEILSQWRNVMKLPVKHLWDLNFWGHTQRVYNTKSIAYFWASAYHKALPTGYWVLQHVHFPNHHGTSLGKNPGFTFHIEIWLVHKRNLPHRKNKDKWFM